MSIREIRLEIMKVQTKLAYGNLGLIEQQNLEVALVALQSSLIKALTERVSELEQDANVIPLRKAA